MRYIIAICFLAFSLTACNTATKKDEKIDFTKSYETAAMALTDAQLAYDAAVASNDTTRIAAAKVQLEAAKTGYLKSKTYYTENGGIVKPEYEQLLVKTNTALGKAPNDTTTVAPALGAATYENDLKKEPLLAAKKIIDSGTFRASKKIKQASDAIATSQKQIQQVSDAVTDGEKQVKQNVTKANEDLTKVRDTTKKRIDEMKKQANDFRNLFKKKVDTGKQN
ncbi:hypothetical protein [Pedobacter rhodius]|uniref:DUF4398 domain-containing protein n=1 Tax=Pedobacter rhodius TaxID=3004098 RepID=A0ABT4KU22_9SPHI|nr:hypothetical protein [Pedobacter sp. SJ11]MCZ4222329.1 hypothetical protein [Pedobacter sp. SJ11]